MTVDRAAVVPAVEHDEPPRWVRVAAIAAVVLPIVVAVVRALRNHWFPIGDDALLYLRTRDVLTDHHPFLGSWTSASLIVGENMNNPGQLHADLIAPFAHALSPGPGAAIGVGTLNAAAVVGASAAARHVGGWAAQRWVLLACAALTWTMGSELLIDIWQAHAMLLPFLVYLVLLVGIAIGRTRCIPWAVAVASLLVQTHVSYAYAVTLFTAVAVVLWWRAERPVRRTDLTAGLRAPTTTVSLGVLLVLWAQPIWEQLFGAGKGNLSRLVSNSSGGDLTIGPKQGLQIVAAVVGLPPWWTRSGFSDSVPATRLTETSDGTTLRIPGLPNVLLAVTVVTVLVVALVLLARRAERVVSATRRPLAAACWLSAAFVLLAAVCLALVSVGQVGLAPHPVRWIWTLAVFVDVVAVWAVIELLVLPRPRSSPRPVDLSILLVGAVLVVAAIPYHSHPQGPVADYDKMPALRRVFRTLEPLRDVDPVLYDVSNLRVFEPYSSAVMMRMQELGIEFRVTDEVMVRQLGPSRRADGDERVRVFQLEGVDALTYDGPACPLAIASAVAPEVERSAENRVEVLADALAAGGLAVADSSLAGAEADALAAVRAGDVGIARRVVMDGTLQRWTEAGLVTAAPASDTAVGAALEAGFADVGSWVTTAYGLFADGFATCP